MTRQLGQNAAREVAAFFKLLKAFRFLSFFFILRSSG